MNKTTFLLFFIGFIFQSQAQFSILSNVGRLEDGDIMSTNTIEESGAKLSFKIQNQSTNNIHVRLRVVDISNTDGSQVSLCFGGDCVSDVQSGAVFPRRAKEFYTIKPGEVFDLGQNYIWNLKTQGLVPDENISYTLEFEQLSEGGGKPIRSLQFTYEYEVNKGISVAEKDVEAEIVRTMINDGVLIINAREAVSLQIYNLIGRQIKIAKLNRGRNTIDISDLSSQIYLIRMQNEKGLVKTQKIVVE